MSDLNRREWMVALAGVAVAGTAKGQGAVVPGSGSLGKSRVLVPDFKKAASGAERWGGPAGTLDTGEVLSLHESVVPAGSPASPAHRIEHSELILVQEGTLEYLHDGVTERAEAGSVIYVGYGTNHSVKNVGAGTARYFVVQVGGDTKKS